MIAPRQIRLYRDSEVEEIPAPEWLIEGMLQKRKLAQLFGEEASLKSFLVLSMAYAVAHGIPWAGRDVRRGIVVYLYMEGGDSLQDRRAAWKLANGFGLAEDADVFFMAEGLNMMDDDGTELEALIESIEAHVGGRVDLIVVDTLQRAFGGRDPNTPKDMNLFVSRCDRLREHFDSAVAVIHHTGWDTSREANARSLRTACDTVIMVSRSGESLDVKLSFEKQKGAGHMSPVRLTLQEVELVNGRTSLAVPGEASLTEANEDVLAFRTLEVLAHMRRATFTDLKNECNARGIDENAFKRDRKECIRRGWMTAPPGEGIKGFEYSVTGDGYKAISENGSELTVARSLSIPSWRSAPQDTWSMPQSVRSSSAYSGDGVR